jgi:hypothetical protein
MVATVIARGIEVVGSVTSKSSEILTPEPLEFVAGSRQATGGGRRASLGVFVNVTVCVHVNVGLRAHEGRPREAGYVPASHPRRGAVAREVSRSLFWQSIRLPGGVPGDGRKVTAEPFQGARMRSSKRPARAPTPWPSAIASSRP